jgi:hypothetical protein
MRSIINIILFILFVPPLALYVSWDVLRTAWMKEVERMEREI